MYGKVDADKRQYFFQEENPLRFSCGPLRWDLGWMVRGGEGYRQATTIEAGYVKEGRKKRKKRDLMLKGMESKIVKQMNVGRGVL